MKTLIRFLLKSKTFFLFLFLEIVILIVNHNQFQRSRFLNSSNVVVGRIYEFSNSVSEYFSLKTVNENLAKENAVLRNQLYTQKNELDFIKQDTNYQGRKNFAVEKDFTFITAKVINASTNKYYNYITLDKGNDDGVRPNMGVINELGVVGIVKSVSEHFSIVLPILNPESKISAKVKNGGNAGSLVWDGKDARRALLQEVPLYFPVVQGDTITTSGNSSIFPEGINVGVVHDFRKENDNFYFIEVSLFTNFHRLSYVDVISFGNAKEQKELEEKEAVE